MIASLATASVGILLIFTAMFTALCAGIAHQQGERTNASMLLLFSLATGVMGIILLLVRS